MICTAFAKLCELIVSQGNRDLNKTPGMHSCRIDDDWRAELNPHDEPIGNVPPLAEWPHAIDDEARERIESADAVLSKYKTTAVCDSEAGANRSR